MARAAYNETIASIASDGTLKAIGNVQVAVRKVSDNSLAALWNDRTASLAGNQVANPFSTATTGSVSFYADSGEYNITFTDLNAPARIATQTIGWDAVSGSQSVEITGFAMGDLKLSSQSADHGRWLKLNGRELTQAEIESALSLAAGSAAAFVAYMGTGSSSKYGAAASSKVKLPDTRRKALVGAGPTADTTPAPMAGTTAKPLGDTAGAETVTLTADQSGVRTHTHAAGTYAAASHTHAGGTYATASHTHSDGTLSVAAHQHDNGDLFVEPHKHGPGTLTVAAHNHGAGTLAMPNHIHVSGGLYTGDHHHGFLGTTSQPSMTGFVSNGAGANTNIPTYIHTHTFGGNTGGSVADSILDPNIVYGNTGNNLVDGSHSNVIAGATANAGPAVGSGLSGNADANGISGWTSMATADVTGATGAATPGLTGASAGATAAVTGTSANPGGYASGGSDAVSSHTNMQPYVSVGYVFIRV